MLDHRRNARFEQAIARRLGCARKLDGGNAVCDRIVYVVRPRERTVACTVRLAKSMQVACHRIRALAVCDGFGVAFDGRIHQCDLGVDFFGLKRSRRRFDRLFDRNRRIALVGDGRGQLHRGRRASRQAAIHGAAVSAHRYDVGIGRVCNRVILAVDADRTRGGQLDIARQSRRIGDGAVFAVCQRIGRKRRVELAGKLLLLALDGREIAFDRDRERALDEGLRPAARHDRNFRRQRHLRIGCAAYDLRPVILIAAAGNLDERIVGRLPHDRRPRKHASVRRFRLVRKRHVGRHRIGGIACGKPDGHALAVRLEQALAGMLVPVEHGIARLLPMRFGAVIRQDEFEGERPVRRKRPRRKRARVVGSVRDRAVRVVGGVRYGGREGRVGLRRSGFGRAHVDIGISEFGELFLEHVVDVGVDTVARLHLVEGKPVERRDGGIDARLGRIGCAGGRRRGGAGGFVARSSLLCRGRSAGKRIAAGFFGLRRRRRRIALRRRRVLDLRRRGVRLHERPVRIEGVKACRVAFGESVRRGER